MHLPSKTSLKYQSEKSSSHISCIFPLLPQPGISCLHVVFFTAQNCIKQLTGRIMDLSCISDVIGD